MGTRKDHKAFETSATAGCCTMRASLQATSCSTQVKLTHANLSHLPWKAHGLTLPRCLQGTLQDSCKLREHSAHIR